MTHINWIYQDGLLVATGENGEALAWWICPPTFAMLADLFNRDQRFGHMLKELLRGASL